MSRYDRPMLTIDDETGLILVQCTIHDNRYWLKASELVVL